MGPLAVEYEGNRASGLPHELTVAAEPPFQPGKYILPGSESSTGAETHPHDPFLLRTQKPRCQLPLFRWPDHGVL